MFQKAKPEQARLKIGIYGPTGSGKTFTSLLIAEGLAAARDGRVAYIDTERGTDFYAMDVPARKIHPTAFDFDAMYSRSLADATAAVRTLDPTEHPVIVLDSVTHMWEAAMDAYEGRKTSIGTIPIQGWSQIKRIYKALVTWLIESNHDVILCGREKNVFETDSETGDLRKVGVTMRAEGETLYEPHIACRMEAKADAKDTTATTYLLRIEKDRTGMMAGRTFPNPTWATFEPLLALLGTEQARMESPDDRAEKDAELLDQAASKRQKKEEKSRVLFTQLATQLTSCDSLELVNEVAATIKKQKRYLFDEHLARIRELYKSRRDQLAEIIAKEDI